MPIQYRCRCGQEVVLRQRESVYLVVALILALTLVNTVFAVLLWNRLGALEERTPHSTETQSSQRFSGQQASRSPASSSSEASESVASSKPVVPVSSSGDAMDRAESLGSDATDAGERIPVDERRPAIDQPSTLPSPFEDTDDRSRAKTEAARAAGPIELMRPDGVDPLAFCHILAEREADPSVWLAAAAWGSGPVRDYALEEMRRGPWEPLVGLVEKPSRDVIRVEAGERGERAELLADIAAKWSDTWQQLLPLRGDSPWSQDVRTALNTPTDNVLVVDLTQSMTEELPHMVRSLRRIVNLTAGQQRWAWITFRDDVVDTFPLTDDVEAFAASLSNWETGDGGDVPEGVDRALFAGLRFGAFEWNPSARHRFIVLGDAPPPYARIRPMVSLVEAAAQSPEKHQVSCLGILREEEFRVVPGFRELAKVSGGVTLFLEEGDPVESALWRLIVGIDGCPWEDRPASVRALF